VEVVKSLVKTVKVVRSLVKTCKGLCNRGNLI